MDSSVSSNHSSKTALPDWMCFLPHPPPPVWGHTTLFWKKYLAVPLGVAPHVKAAFAILFLICKIPVLIAMCTRGFLNNSAGSVKSDCTTNNSEAMVRPFKTIFPIKFLMSHFLRSWVGEVAIWCRNLYLCPQVNTYMVSILERLGWVFFFFLPLSPQSTSSTIVRDFNL